MLAHQYPPVKLTDFQCQGRSPITRPLVSWAAQSKYSHARFIMSQTVHPSMLEGTGLQRTQTSVSATRLIHSSSSSNRLHSNGRLTVGAPTSTRQAPTTRAGVLPFLGKETPHTTAAPFHRGAGCKSRTTPSPHLVGRA